MDLNDATLTQASIIGSMLIDEKCIGSVVAEVQPGDFLSEPYRMLFLTIRKLFHAGRPVDPVTVLDALKGAGAVDWYSLIEQCMTMTPTSANVDAYVSVLREQARLERIRQLGIELTTAPTMETAQESIAKLNAEQVDKPGVKITTMAQGLEDFIRRHNEKVEYLPWGIRELDKKLYIGPGKFIILGGYASHGKTAFALQTAYSMAAKYRVGFFSLETDDGTLMDRLVSSVAKVSMGAIKTHDLSDEDYQAVAAHSKDMIGRKLEFILAAGMTVSDIFATARSRRYDVIFVDYIQIIRGNNNRTRTEEITGISIELHTMAQSSGITVVGLSQLTRAEKSPKGQRAPRMSDLRESGQLEQDADVVMLLYREKMDAPESPRILSVEKNKEGETGQLTLRFDGPTQTFRSSYGGPPPPLKGQFRELKGPDNDMPF